jgi:DNA mismatch repair protein MutS
VSSQRTQPQQPPADAALTPAMRQYWEQKAEAGDAILLFRMGDFYELFYDDAELGARVLGITLTSRDGGRTPLAGIPHHALESYLARLVAAGYRVAISEQIEDAKQAKGVVKRAIVRVVTPGTLTDDALLDQHERNLLAAVCRDRDDAGLALLELSTGQFHVQLLSAARLPDELERLAPAEILFAEQAVSDAEAPLAQLRDRLTAAFTPRPAADFAPHYAEQLLREQFEVQTLEGFGFSRIDTSLRAAGALLAYARETQKGLAAHIQPPRRHHASAHMVLDAATLRALEVIKTMRGGGRSGSLCAAVDRTGNPMGARLLRTWLCYPLAEINAIERRQTMVAALREADAQRQGLQRAIREVGDIERLVGRVGVRRTNPRDLRALGDGLTALATIRELLHQVQTPEANAVAEVLTGLDPLAERLTSALKFAAPTTLREGGIFNAGINEELDRLRQISEAGETWLAEFQAREAERLGIPKLKVGFNKVFGYYIEVTNLHRDRVPENYVRKQTVKNAERYIVDELKQYETETLTAAARANELEHDLFQALRDEVAQRIPAMQRAAEALAELDILAGWAELALKQRYSRPEFDPHATLEITAGRHPVVEQTQDHFVANDTRLTSPDALVALITGPNMAGKSTYIRQVALLTLLAHCGCWVPAEQMRLGLVDRIFTRVGAADELARGQSTFMVEMLETANILHNATARSLVILDEVGRGTSTFDGLALAWAIAEQLADRVSCRTLFATHYHEMTELAELLEPVFNLNVVVKEYEEQLVFLHRIAAGTADRSYGLHVAKLAGVPRNVLERANAVLNELERTFARESQRPALAAVQRRRSRQLRLFEEPEEAIVRELRRVDPKALPADEARELIRRWHQRLAGEDPPPNA